MTFLEWLSGLDPTQTLTVLIGPSGATAGIIGYIWSKRRKPSPVEKSTPEQQEQALKVVQAPTLDQQTLEVSQAALSMAVEANRKADRLLARNAELESKVGVLVRAFTTYRTWVQDVRENWTSIRLRETAPPEPEVEKIDIIERWTTWE